VRLTLRLVGAYAYGQDTVLKVGFATSDKIPMLAWWQSPTSCHRGGWVVRVQTSLGAVDGVGRDVGECGVEGFAQRLNISCGLCE
jgi:hypothetical protein